MLIMDDKIDIENTAIVTQRSVPSDGDPKGGIQCVCPEAQAFEVKTMGGKIDARSKPAVANDFEVYLVWSDTTLQVRSDQTLLSVLIDAGVAISPGCLTGGCGECATAYIEGDVIHKDSCLSAIDRERFLCPCVSRARSRIVIAA